MAYRVLKQQMQMQQPAVLDRDILVDLALCCLPLLCLQCKKVHSFIWRNHDSWKLTCPSSVLTYILAKPI